MPGRPGKLVLGSRQSAGFAVVLVTAPDLRTARRLATVLVRTRLAACVNIIPNLESHYTWKGKVEKAREVLLVIKTRRSRLSALWISVQNAHPYETPEFLVLSVAGGSSDYLAWLSASTA